MLCSTAKGVTDLARAAHPHGNIRARPMIPPKRTMARASTLSYPHTHAPSIHDNRNKSTSKKPRRTRRRRRRRARRVRRMR